MGNLLLLPFRFLAMLTKGIGQGFYLIFKPVIFLFRLLFGRFFGVMVGVALGLFLGKKYLDRKKNSNQ